ncbi:MAG: ATP-binding protein [Firmicutes bacterium]|nr:ATP-binding protein [Bacillota bacterium]
MTSSSATQLTYRCPKCGRENRPLELNILGQTRYIRRVCPCMDEERQREEAARQELERKLRIEKLFSVAELGPRFAECTFENWRSRPGTAAAYRAALEYAKRFEEHRRAGSGLIIYGQPGTGKSHLAAAITNRLLSQGIPCIFQSVPALLKRIQATWDGGTVKERDLIQALTEADLLVLDDAGAEQWSTWSESTLYYVVDERYRWKRPLVVTSNCDPEFLERQVGARTFDRLAEMCFIVANQGSSYRKERARARLRREA